MKEIENQRILVEHIKGLAEIGSNLIYIYPYTEYEERSFLPDIGAAAPIKGQHIPIHSIVGREEGPIFEIERPKNKVQWAIRIEGNTNPLDKVFVNKELALAHAKTLVKSGLGRKIVTA